MVKKDVLEGWNILFEGSCNASVLAGARAPRRDTLAPASTSAVFDRLLELEQLALHAAPVSFANSTFLVKAAVQCVTASTHRMGRLRGFRLARHAVVILS